MTELRELDKELAEWMGLAEVQDGHLSYWFTPSSCGWRAEAGPVSKCDGPMPDRATIVFRVAPESQQLTGYNGLAEVPFYSADIAAAFQVVEWLRTRNWQLTLESWGTDWAAEFRQITRYESYSAQTAAEAICRAALELKRLEEYTG